jgi:hypothetical protein
MCNSFFVGESSSALYGREGQKRRLARFLTNDILFCTCCEIPKGHHLSLCKFANLFAWRMDIRCVTLEIESVGISNDCLNEQEGRRFLATENPHLASLRPSREQDRPSKYHSLNPITGHTHKVVPITGCKEVRLMPKTAKKIGCGNLWWWMKVMVKIACKVMNHQACDL